MTMRVTATQLDYLVEDCRVPTNYQGRARRAANYLQMSGWLDAQIGLTGGPHYRDQAMNELRRAGVLSGSWLVWWFVKMALGPFVQRFIEQWLASEPLADRQ